MRILDLRVKEGLEISAFNDHNRTINEVTKDLMLSLSCSGFNTRSEYGRLEVIKTIRELVKRQRKLFKTSSTNGCANVWPSLVIVQNYGIGIYGIETKATR